MAVLNFFLVAFVRCIISGSRLMDLPNDITYHVMSHFDIGEKVSYVSVLNRKFNKDFNQKHQAEIKNVKKMKDWFEDNEYADHLDAIGAMSSKLKMSELYHLHLPIMLATLQGYWSTGMAGGAIVTHTLIKMRIFPQSLADFINISDTSLPDALRLLLLASRSLINYFVPNWYANTNVGPLVYQPYRNGIAPFNYWSNFIWLRPDHSNNLYLAAPEPTAFETDLWPIYFSYLYEFYFNALDAEQSSLTAASVFHLEGKAKSNLIRLINEFDFVPWAQSTLRQIRSDFHDCDVHLLYSDFVRVDMNLHYHQMTHDERIKFRIFLVIQSLEDGHCSIPIEPNSQMAFKQDLLDLIYWSWCGYHTVQYEKLIQILSGFLFKVDPFIVGFVSGQSAYTNDTFASELMYRLWEMSGLDVNEYENGFKELIVNGVINKSKYYWNENDHDAAKMEVSKLAHDERLFDKDALVLLIANAEEDDVTKNDFLIECLLLLTELRTDWDLDAATDKAKSSLTKEVLMVQGPILT